MDLCWLSIHLVVAISTLRLVSVTIKLIRAKLEPVEHVGWIGFGRFLVVIGLPNWNGLGLV
jgi:hypothetical protein